MENHESSIRKSLKTVIKRMNNPGLMTSIISLLEYKLGDNAYIPVGDEATSPVPPKEDNDKDIPRMSRDSVVYSSYKTAASVIKNAYSMNLKTITKGLKTDADRLKACNDVLAKFRKYYNKAVEIVDHTGNDDGFSDLRNFVAKHGIDPKATIGRTKDMKLKVELLAEAYAVKRLEQFY